MVSILLASCCACFRPIASFNAVATSMSLLSSRNHLKFLSMNLDTFIQTLCSHSFCAESAKAPHLVNMPILPSKDLALSISFAVGLVFLVNANISFTNSEFHAVGLTFVPEILAKLGNTSLIHFFKSFIACTVQKDVLLFANNAFFCKPLFFIISVSCVWSFSLFQLRFLLSIHCGAASISITPSSDNLESLSDAFFNAEGVTSPEDTNDFGNLSVTQLDNLLYAEPIAGIPAHKTHPAIAHAHSFHCDATSKVPHCKAHSKAPRPTFQAVVTALLAIPPIGAVSAVCHANCHALEYGDCGFNPPNVCVVDSIQDASFSAQELIL